MTPEQQEAKRRAEVMLAFANGAPIECRKRDRPDLEWNIVTKPAWDWVLYNYRVSETPVVNWDAMPAWANFVFKSKDGDWWWCTHHPYLDGKNWMWQPGSIASYMPPEHAPKYAGTKPWHELIIERPKK